MTPEGALAVALDAGRVNWRRRAMCDAAHLLCVHRGHRHAATAALYACPRCRTDIEHAEQHPTLEGL